MIIYCCNCEEYVESYTATGSVVYGRRFSMKAHLAKRLYWGCPKCRRFVGTHKNTGMPLGTIPSAKLAKLRWRIHQKLDPLWKVRKLRRKDIYKELSKLLGNTYHTATVGTEVDANKVLNYLQKTYYDNTE